MGFFDALGRTLNGINDSFTKSVAIKLYDSLKRVPENELVSIFNVEENIIKKIIILIILAEKHSYHVKELLESSNFEKRNFSKYTEISETRRGAIAIMEILNN